MDGYFPSELQMRYPDGIPLQVSSAKPYSSAFWKQLLSCFLRKLFQFLSPICWMLPTASDVWGFWTQHTCSLILCMCVSGKGWLGAHLLEPLQEVSEHFSIRTE